MMSLMGIYSTFVISSEIAAQSKISDTRTPTTGSVETFTPTNYALILVGMESPNLAVESYLQAVTNSSNL